MSTRTLMIMLWIGVPLWLWASFEKFKAEQVRQQRVEESLQRIEALCTPHKSP